MYLNKITGVISTVDDLTKIRGNVIYRGLQNDYIKLDAISMEYGRLVNQLRKNIQKGSLSNFNTVKAINDLKRI